MHICWVLSSTCGRAHYIYKYMSSFYTRKWDHIYLLTHTGLEYVQMWTWMWVGIWCERKCKCIWSVYARANEWIWVCMWVWVSMCVVCVSVCVRLRENLLVRHSNEILEPWHFFIPRYFPDLCWLYVCFVFCMFVCVYTVLIGWFVCMHHDPFWSVIFFTLFVMLCVCVCACVCLYICMYMCMHYLLVCVYWSLCFFWCVCLFVCMYVCMYTCIRMYIHVCVCVSVCLCECLCLCVHLYVLVVYVRTHAHANLCNNKIWIMFATTRWGEMKKHLFNNYVYVHIYRCVLI